MVRELEASLKDTDYIIWDFGVASKSENYLIGDAMKSYV